MKKEKDQPDTHGPWKTKQGVLQYLLHTGWDIKKQTFYNHSGSLSEKNPYGGKLAKEKGGFYTKKAVDKYAEQFLSRVDSEHDVKNEETTSMVAQKQEEEVGRIRADRRLKEITIQKELKKIIPREDFERELALRLLVLHTDYKNLINTEADRIIHLVNGDLKSMSDFIAALMDLFDKCLQSYATTKKFHVLVM
jgi:hypothetical protein